MINKKGSATLSANVVKYLQEEGHTQRSIGHLLEVHESYISHVLKGNRNFTIDHLERLAEVLDTTLPELLALATPLESIPKSRRKTYEALLKSLKAGSEFRDHLGRKKKREVEAVGA
jgi:plasmid maintenance system antidote protein VapI